MTRIIPVFVNSAKVELPAESTALDAIRLWNADAALEVTSGVRIVLDDRGLPIDSGTVIHGGSIYRLVPVRAAADPADEPAE
ncbi:MAG: hypothetical protein M3Y05_16300 [Gemmatimonadota bacterium]|nr:hypothetical protein [Gemmatimonadota bacterium]